uniref:Uncharacterized protein n=1 Tax=Oryza punctata TaxID=4537 RepID=A0A0E0L469_ORYPU
MGRNTKVEKKKTPVALAPITKPLTGKKLCQRTLKLESRMSSRASTAGKKGVWSPIVSNPPMSAASPAAIIPLSVMAMAGGAVAAPADALYLEKIKLMRGSLCLSSSGAWGSRRPACKCGGARVLEEEGGEDAKMVRRATTWRHVSTTTNWDECLATCLAFLSSPDGRPLPTCKVAHGVE